MKKFIVVLCMLLGAGKAHAIVDVSSTSLYLGADTTRMIPGVYTSALYFPPLGSFTYGYDFRTGETSRLVFNFGSGAVDFDSMTTVSAMSASGSGLGAYLEGSKSYNNVLVQVHCEIVNNPEWGTSVHSMMMRVRLTNNGSTTLPWAVRYMIDTMVYNADGAQVSIDNGFHTIEDNTVYRASSSNVPDSWWDYDTLPLLGPVLVGRGWNKNNNTSYNPAATAPDVFEVADWQDTSGYGQWTVAGSDVITDSSVVYWWTGSGSESSIGQTFAPGQTREVVLYYGINQGSLLATLTPLPTSTASPTLTATRSASPTATPTRSSSPTPTRSTTPTATRTSSATPTVTVTQTSTASPTTTETPSITKTPKKNGTPVPNTFTSTPTISGTFTATATVTLTSTYSTTPTPSSSLTNTPTSSGTPSSTRTRTTTPTFSPTRTATASSTQTATPVVTPTPIPTPGPCHLVDGEDAILVLAQPDFNTKNLPETVNAQNVAWEAGEMTSDGQYFYGVDNSANRIKIYNRPLTSNNESAIGVIGQPEMTSSDVGSGPGGLNYPTGLYIDGQKLYLADNGNSRITIYNLPISGNGPEAVMVLGQSDLYSGSENQGGSTPSATSMRYPGYVTGDSNQLFVSDSGNQRILVYNLPITTTGQAADFVIGQPDFSHRFINHEEIEDYLAHRDSLCMPGGIFSDGNVLYVADYGNYRVLTFQLPITANEPEAQYVLGQVDFTTNDVPSVSASSVLPFSLGSDRTRLFVPDLIANRVLSFNLPITANFQAANNVLGQANFTDSVSNHGAGADYPNAGGLSFPWAVHGDGYNLYVGDCFNHRWVMYPCIPDTESFSMSFGSKLMTMSGMSMAGESTASPDPTLAPVRVKLRTDLSPIFIGDEVQATIRVCPGSRVLANLTVSLAIPESLEYVAGSATGKVTFDASTRSLRWNFSSSSDCLERSFRFKAKGPFHLPVLRLNSVVQAVFVDDGSVYSGPGNIDLLSLRNSGRRGTDGTGTGQTGGMSIAGVKDQPRTTPDPLSRFLNAEKPLMAFPNPAVRSAKVGYFLKSAAKVRVKLMSLYGQELQSLDLGTKPAGISTAALDLGTYASGLYFVVLEVDEGFGWTGRSIFKLSVLK